ncbi:hypothetical protein [Emcibacter sp.]|uniref:hypothetical protein n=1 Tax=Emcibacter sp. TaxID=1979954 RepID=UPI003A8D10B1
MKKEARLTGALLARKGQAVPSPAAPKFAMPAINRFERVDEGGTAEENRTAIASNKALENSIESVRKLSELQGGRTVPTDERPAPAAAEKFFGRREKTDAVVTKAPKKAAKKTTKKATKKKAGTAKRIAMTLRMTEEDHLKLRLYSAHTRKSCQEVLTDALDQYLAHETGESCGTNCSCLTE